MTNTKDPDPGMKFRILRVRIQKANIYGSTGPESVAQHRVFTLNDQMKITNGIPIAMPELCVTKSS